MLSVRALLANLAFCERSRCLVCRDMYGPAYRFSGPLCMLNNAFKQSVRSRPRRTFCNSLHFAACGIRPQSRRGILASYSAAIALFVYSMKAW